LEIGSLADYFRCTYVINLPERKDRLKAITGEFERAGMPFRRGSVEIFPAVKPTERLGFPNTGARGCFLSHLGVLRSALARNLCNVLIAEDDLMLLPVLTQSLDYIRDRLDSLPWGIVFFGHVEQSAETGTPQLVPFHDPILTSYFYAVNGPIIPRLVKYLEQVQHRQPGDPLGGPMPLDGALTMFRQANPDVLTLIAQPVVGKQRPSRSNISCHWYERLPVVQQAADLAREVREFLRERS
jgi:hypothetical protein